MDENTKQQMNVSQKVVLYNPEDKKVLLVCDSSTDSEASKKYGAWELPGGHIENGETDMAQALDREIREEIGGEVKYELRETIGAGFIQLNQDSRVNVVYLGIYKGGEIKLSDEHSEYRWQTFDDVEKSNEYTEYLKNFVRNAAIHVKAAEFLDDLKRLKADFENYKRRIASEKDELSRYMVNTIVADLVPILDNFNMAVNHVPEDKKSDPWVTGITYIEKQFEETLSRYGVKTLEVKSGDPFDPTKHEAVEHHEKEGAAKIVIEKVLQKGYQIGDKVIRPARVSVGGQ